MLATMAGAIDLGAVKARSDAQARAASQPPLEPAGVTGHLAACFRSREVGRETGAAA